MSDKKGSEEEGESSQTDGEREVERRWGAEGTSALIWRCFSFSPLPDWPSLLCPVANEDTCVRVNVCVWLKIQRRGVDRLKVRCGVVNEL